MNQKFKVIIKSSGMLPVYHWLKDPLGRIKFYGEGFKYYIFNHILTHFPNHWLRIFYLRNVIGIPIGKECFIHMGCFFAGNNIFIGNNTVIGRNCYLGGGGKLIIKNNVSITAQTYIFCATHLTNSSTFECVHKDVIIEDYAWIGARAMILPGVRIGRGSVLGAASTATKDIPDYSVYAGTPAKEVGQREKELIYTLKYFPCFQ
jgi:acetyltransferase-like isoleucine patch superfamily enzyme